MKKISGIDTPVKGGMAVLKPFDIRAHSPDGYVFTRWLATLPLWTPLIILALIGVYPSIAYAQSAFSISDFWGAVAMDAVPTRLRVFVQYFDFILDAGNRNRCGGGIGARTDFNFWPVARVFLVYNAAFSQFAMAGDLIYCATSATI